MTDRERVRDAYDEIAGTYDEQRDDDPPETALLDSVVDRLPDDPRVLDAGCGSGEPITRRLATRATVTGVDFSRSQLDLATDRLPGTAFVQGDLTALPFRTDAFDGLVSAYAVIHVPWEEHATVFEEFRRVLRPAAPLLVSVGSDDWEGSTDDWLGGGAEMHWSQPGPDRTAALLREAGFAVERTAAVADTLADDEAESNVDDDDDEDDQDDVGEKVFVWATA
ncbi:MAG: SAM-dependent methyltransferase [Halobacteriales archaeon]|jgi:SAM-dependent methyltransferase